MRLAREQRGGGSVWHVVGPRTLVPVPSVRRVVGPHVGPAGVGLARTLAPVPCVGPANVGLACGCDGRQRMSLGLGAVLAHHA